MTARRPLPSHFAIVLIAVALGAGASHAQEERATRPQIDRLMELTGAREMGQQMGIAMADQFYAALAQANPSLPLETRGVIAGVTIGLLEEELDSLLERTVPLYQRHFSKTEIGELIAFYESPIGRKTVEVMPQLMQESVAVGQAWAAALQPEVERRLRAALSEHGLM